MVNIRELQYCKTVEFRGESWQSQATVLESVSNYLADHDCVLLAIDLTLDDDGTVTATVTVEDCTS